MTLNDLKCIENLDIDEYYDYFINIKNKMSHPDWLGDLEKDDFIKMINAGGKTWTYFDNDKFVCSQMYIVGTQKGIDHLGLNYKEEECADCGPMFVAEDYRGNGLQFQMLQKLEEYCKKMNKKYILTTAHPENVYSSNNMIKAGYKKVGSRVLGRGPRDIYVKEI